MKRPAKRKCRHRKEFFRPDPRNRHHQRYCSKPACRQQSKADAQRRCLQKPENQGHFRGPENSQRVKAWRKAHPGYWRKGKPEAERPLQDLCGNQLPENEQLTKESVRPALQDLLLTQPTLVVGLISAMTGSTLQEDIADAVRRLQRKGQDILGTNATESLPKRPSLVRKCHLLGLDQHPVFKPVTLPDVRTGVRSPAPGHRLPLLSGLESGGHFGPTATGAPRAGAPEPWPFDVPLGGHPGQSVG
jgi:hypothetical protein